jgi:hypothetical protein
MSNIKKPEQEAAGSSLASEKVINNLPVGAVVLDTEGLVFVLQQAFLNKTAPQKPVPQMFQDGLIVGLIEGIATSLNMDRIIVLGLVKAIAGAWGIVIDEKAIAARIVGIMGFEDKTPKH